MNIRSPHVRIARIVLEAVSPLSVASGRASLRFDTAVVRDANDLPTIPGSSLAGVLRHLYTEAHGEAAARALFGYAHQQGENEREDAPSRLSVSWGAVLDSEGRAVEGLLLGKEAQRLDKDPLLALLRREAPVARRRVRINHRGAADAEARGLFDRVGVPRGTRFAFELLLQSDDPAALDEEWARLRALFAHPALRLGGATRAGMGEVRCVRWHEAAFHFTGDEGKEHWRRFRKLGRRLDEVEGMQPQDLHAATRAAGWKRIVLKLAPEAGFRVGGLGGGPLGNYGDDAPDATPHHEPVVVWKNGRAEVRWKQPVVPASALKGVIAHRVAFHANRLAGRWGQDAPVGEDCPEVAALFGKAAGAPDAHAGRLFFTDIWLGEDIKPHLITHASVDRFTGGVREGLLFREEVLWGGKLVGHIWLHEAALADEVGERARKALALALDDLVQGRLAIGADAAAGHGFVRGQWEEADG